MDKSSKLMRLAVAAALAVAVSGCANLSPRENIVLGAVIGAGVGAVAGASVGHAPPRRVQHTRVVEVHEHHDHRRGRHHRH